MQPPSMRGHAGPFFPIYPKISELQEMAAHSYSNGPVPTPHYGFQQCREISPVLRLYGQTGWYFPSLQPSSHSFQHSDGDSALPPGFLLRYGEGVRQIHISQNDTAGSFPQTAFVSACHKAVPVPYQKYHSPCRGLSLDQRETGQNCFSGQVPALHSYTGNPGTRSGHPPSYNTCLSGTGSFYKTLHTVHSHTSSAYRASYALTEQVYFLSCRYHSLHTSIIVPRSLPHLNGSEFLSVSAGRYLDLLSEAVEYSFYQIQTLPLNSFHLD